MEPDEFHDHLSAKFLKWCRVYLVVVALVVIAVTAILYFIESHEANNIPPKYSDSINVKVNR